MNHMKQLQGHKEQGDPAKKFEVQSYKIRRLKDLPPSEIFRASYPFGHLAAHGFQTVQGVQQGLVLLGEVQANQMVHRLSEKAGTGYRAYADLDRKSVV